MVTKSSTERLRAVIVQFVVVHVQHTQLRTRLK